MAELTSYWITVDGSEYFYDKTQVKHHGDKVYVWQKIRFSKQNEGAWSGDSYSIINCTDYSIQNLQFSIYSDKNWSAKLKTFGKQPKDRIPANSVVQKLADILCGNTI